jgi:hypothetical protein
MANLASPVWGNVSYFVSSDHGEEATWVSDYPTPCQLYEYTHNYGMTGCKHPGIDVQMPAGTPIYALRAGSINWIRNAGQTNEIEVRVLDSQGHLMLYHHLQSSVVSQGQSVSVGQLLGYSGHPSGSSAHLHFEHRIPDSSTVADWRIIDPVPALTGGSTPPPPTGNKFAVDDKVYNHTSSANNLRATPSGTVVGTMASNADGCVLEGPTASGGYNWYKLTVGSVTGWCADANLTMRTAGGCTATPPPPPPPTTKFAVNDKVYNHTSSANNLRATTSPTGTILGTLPANADACVVEGPTTANGYTWYKVTYGSITGWCVETYLTLRTAGGCAATPPPTTTWTHKANQNLNFRATASATGTLLGVIYTNDRVQWLKNASGQYVTVISGGYTWANVKSERHNQTGWCVSTGLVAI